MSQENGRMTCKTFDQSIRILFWTLDEFIILIPMCLLGVFLHSLFLLCFAIALKAIYTKVKKNRRHRHLTHYLYQYFPTLICQRLGFFEGIPPSHLKEVILT